MAEEAKLKSQMGSDEPVKFTDEELSSLQELQNTYASISTQFGQVKVSRINLERQMENLDDGENQLEQNWEETRQKESVINTRFFPDGPFTQRITYRFETRPFLYSFDTIDLFR